MTALRTMIDECLDAPTRLDFWAAFLEKYGAASAAEIGVWAGDFAAHILRRCPAIDRYYMIDPWRHLDAWNKPANVDEEKFKAVLAEALEKTRFAAERVKVLQGKTTEVIDEIPDNSLDFVYIDGDHTLKGVAIDLIRAYPKVKPGGVIGGDDFSRSIWQHPGSYEPTLVFPFAVYFAEATGSPIYALPHSQFLMQKQTGEGFVFEKIAGGYDDVELRSQLLKKPRRAPRIKAVRPKIRAAAKKLLGRA